VRLGPRLPDRDKKSLEYIEEQLLKDPRQPVLGLIALDAPRTIHNNLSNSNEIFARIRLLVPLHPEDAEQVEGMIRRSMQARENQLELPLDVSDEVEIIMDALHNPEDDDGSGESTAAEAEDLPSEEVG
jgi:hypothetical protein